MSILLPIEAYRRRLIATIFRPGRALYDRVTILVGGPGTGKSTKLTEYLLADTDIDFVVTQPTRLATITIPQRVADLRGNELGEEIGFQHGGGKNFGKNTRCLFRIDGTQLNESLHSRRSRFKLIVIDEAHKFTLNIELLIWLLQRDPDLRIVIASATIDAEQLSIYFGGAEIVEIEGTMFPIVDVPYARSDEETLFLALQRGRKPLVIEPGEAQLYGLIAKMEPYLRERGMTAELLPLHASLSTRDIMRCLQPANGMRIIFATDFVETSVTLDVDYLLDKEVYNRRELHGRVTGLFSRWTSIAQLVQRRGRICRLRPGEFTGRCPLSRDQRDAFPIPEIHRLRLHTTQLRLREAGLSLQDATLFHPARADRVADADQTLIATQCAGPKLGITDRGKRAAHLPLELEHAVLVLEAHDRGVLDDGIIAAALLEERGIVGRDRTAALAAAVPRDPDSDLVYQVAVYKHAVTLADREQSALGVEPRTIRRVADLIQQTTTALKRYPSISPGSSGDREALLKSILVALSEHTYRFTGQDAIRDDDSRGVPPNCRGSFKEGDLLVGQPFDRNQLNVRLGTDERLKTLLFPTRVKPEWILEMDGPAVSRSTFVHGRYDEESARVFGYRVVTLHGQAMTRELVDVTGSAEAPGMFADWIAGLVFAKVGGYGARQLALIGNDDLHVDPRLPPALDLDREHYLDAPAAAAFRKKIDELAERVLGARRLNQQARRQVFEEWTRRILGQHLATQLEGLDYLPALDVTVLSIPPLDSLLVEQIRAERPARVMVAGKERSVIHELGKPPRVSAKEWWPGIPDEGVLLNGIPVEFDVFGLVGPTADIPYLKRRAAALFPDDLLKFSNG